MKRFLKNILAAVLILTLILSGTLTAFGAEAKGMKVQYNGENITFAGASAKMVSGKAMIPLRQTLAAMGATVTYDSKTKTILAKTADKEISFTAGKTDVTVNENGTKSAEKIDTAPFVEKGLVYLSARDLANLMGYGIGWDAAEKTVVIIDPTPLLATVDDDFTTIYKLMKSDLDLEKAYTTNGKFDMNITTYADPESIMPGMDVSVTGKMSGIQQKSNADLVMSMAFNFDKMLSSLTTEEKTMIEPMLSMYKNVDMKIKMDGETGVTYMNSSLFAAMDPTMDKNTWYKMNVYDTYEDMGIDLKSMTQMSYSDAKLSEILEASFPTMQNIDASTYQDLKTTYAFLKNLIGNDAFRTKTAGSYVTHTLNIDQASIIAALTKTALTEGISNDAMDLTEIGDLLKDSSLGANISIKEKSGVLYNYVLKGSCDYEDMALSFDVAGDSKNADCQMTMDMKDIMKMNINVDSHVAETSQAPDVSLPADAKVVDYPTY